MLLSAQFTSETADLFPSLSKLRQFGWDGFAGWVGLKGFKRLLY